MPAETLLQEVNDLLVEFFGTGDVLSQTDRAIAEGRCRLIVDDELANTVDDTVPCATSSPPD